MTKLAVITTGGTIASVLKDGVFAVEESSSKLGGAVQVAAEQLGFEIEIYSPINKNSESLAPVDWLAILAAIEQACASDVAGVVVLHGTDTMHYTLAAAACFSCSKRVCFTGAMFSPELENSDTHINLLAAMSFAVGGTDHAGAYLAFCDDADRLSASIFHASEVKPLAFDESSFSSVYNHVVARYSEQDGLQMRGSDRTPRQFDLGKLPSRAALIASQQQLAYIKLYPGLDLHALQAVSDGRSVLVMELYHSGTGPASRDYDDLIQCLKASRKDKLFALSAFPANTIQHPYASTQALLKAGADIYADLQPHCLYVMCLLMVAQGKRVDEIKTLLQPIRIVI